MEPFEQFLLSVGLIFQLRRGPDGEPFGNWIVQYGNHDLEVAMVEDRGQQSVTIADKHTLRRGGFLPGPAEYSVPLIREFLFGINPDRMDIFEEKTFVTENWARIVEMFNAEHREATHQRLSLLGRERVKRTFSSWPPAILEFEEFLKGMGLICKAREAPDGILGDRLMQYDSDTLSVKIASKGGWQVMLAERASRPDTWYHIGAIRRLMVGNVDAKVPFQQWFMFPKANWQAINAIFSPAQREETHRLLQPLEEEICRKLQLARDQQKAKLEQIQKQFPQK